MHIGVRVTAQKEVSVSEISLTLEEYQDILAGKYLLIPCDNCDLGTVYVDGWIGEQVTLREYREIQEGGGDIASCLYEITC